MSASCFSNSGSETLAKNTCVRIGKLPKALKRGILWLAAHTKRGRMAEVTDDVYDYARNRYFKVRLHFCVFIFIFLEVVTTRDRDH